MVRAAAAQQAYNLPVEFAAMRMGSSPLSSAYSTLGGLQKYIPRPCYGLFAVGFGRAL